MEQEKNSIFYETINNRNYVYKKIFLSAFNNVYVKLQSFIKLSRAFT